MKPHSLFIRPPPPLKCCTHRCGTWEKSQQAGHRRPAALEVAEGGGAAIWAGGGSGWSWVMVEGRREVLNGKVWQNEKLTIAYADI